MEQDWDTAVAVATGELNAQEAFIGGRIRLTGNQQLLLESQPVFGALDAVFTDRARAHRLLVSRHLLMPELPEVQAHAERLERRVRRPTAGEVRAAHVHGVEDRPPGAGRGLRHSAAQRRASREVHPPALRRGHVHHPPDAGRAAARRREEVGEAARWSGAIRRSPSPTAATHRRCCSPRPAPNAAPGSGACEPDDEESSPPLDKLGPEAHLVTAEQLARAVRCEVATAPRLPTRPAIDRRDRAPARQRGLPPGEALAVRIDDEARDRRRSRGRRRRSPRRSPRDSSTSAHAPT